MAGAGRLSGSQQLPLTLPISWQFLEEWLFPSVQLVQCMAGSSIQQMTYSQASLSHGLFQNTWLVQWTVASRISQGIDFPWTEYPGGFLVSFRGHIFSKFCWHGITELLSSCESQLCSLQQNWGLWDMQVLPWVVYQRVSDCSLNLLFLHLNFTLLFTC